MNFEKELPNVKEKSLQKAKKIITAFVAAGIITIGPGTEAFKNIATSASPEKYIEYAEKQPDGDELKAEMIREKLKFLEEKFSFHIFNHLIMGNKAAKKNNENMPGKPAIAGFENAGIDNKDLEALWSKKYYPVGTVEGNISSIKYMANSAKLTADYNVDGNILAGADEFSDVIEFYDNEIKTDSKEGWKNKIEAFDWCFSHELGHDIDWVNHNNMTPVERAEFLYDVTKAFEKPGSFRDPQGYVDSINNPDKRKENYYKVREYWASLCEHYLTFPELAKDYLSPDEIGMVKKWLERKDKKFDPAKASRDKKILMKAMIEKASRK